MPDTISDPSIAPWPSKISLHFSGQHRAAGAMRALDRAGAGPSTGAPGGALARGE